jgi:effector-binding domain-containing protein
MTAGESCVGAGGVVLKALAPVRVAELTGTAASYGREDVGPALRTLFAELSRRLAATGVWPDGGPRIAYYEDPAVPSDAVIVHAAVPVAAAPPPGHGLALVDLPGVPLAATITHRGPAESVIESLWHLASWIEAAGYLATGYHREVYAAHDPGVAELQVGVLRPAWASGSRGCGWRPLRAAGEAARPAG